MVDQFIEQTVVRFAGDDDHAGVAPFEQSIAVGDVQSRLDRLAAMAFEAVLQQQRPHLLMKEIEPPSHFRGMIRRDRRLRSCNCK